MWHVNYLHLISLKIIENKFKIFTNNMLTIHSLHHLVLKFGTHDIFFIQIPCQQNRTFNIFFIQMPRQQSRTFIYLVRIGKACWW